MPEVPRNACLIKAMRALLADLSWWRVYTLDAASLVLVSTPTTAGCAHFSTCLFGRPTFSEGGGELA